MKENLPKKPSRTKMRFKDDITYEHSLFKLEVANMQKNKKGMIDPLNPDLIEVEHTHFFHDIDDRTGEAQIYSTPTGNHFHEIKITWDRTVSPCEVVNMECGPALTFKNIKGRGGMVQKTAVQVRWNLIEDGSQILKDEHTHVVRYLSTEFINPMAVRVQQEKEQAKIAGMARMAIPVIKAEEPAPTPIVGDAT